MLALEALLVCSFKCFINISTITYAGNTEIAIGDRSVWLVKLNL